MKTRQTPVPNLVGQVDVEFQTSASTFILKNHLFFEKSPAEWQWIVPSLLFSTFYYDDIPPVFGIGKALKLNKGVVGALTKKYWHRHAND